MKSSSTRGVRAKHLTPYLLLRLTQNFPVILLLLKIIVSLQSFNPYRNVALRAKSNFY